ncbi:XdhC family protein [Glaciecola sp. MH2013]|uniref:XdhC family protein n=1 Tax=Glaciecola sp. MH2013 TaxID=2785524 RepID=UPI0018A02895|nr:XdhC/CoxI family protein [Glaciecola sp. MH2013]MBF7074228.1 XdhC family protein [Glaciecola sp. MH2013]
MANHIQQLLNTWFEKRDELQWVLATIIEIDGSSYRKPGAMMMINDLGKYHGLLSGGCLESDIMRQARQCWSSQQAKIIQYDMREEEDIAWQMGIGCGGLVRILLQAVNQENNYLELAKLRELVNANKVCEYHQSLASVEARNEVKELSQLSGELNEGRSTSAKQVHTKLTTETFIHRISPLTRIAIIGGGVDAIPVASIALSLGWRVMVVDHRSAYARISDFPPGVHIVKKELTVRDEHPWIHDIDAAVVMTHNVKLDAEALLLLQTSSAKYIGLLGPTHRTDRVLKHADINREQIKITFANPIGLQLGGELPESIALSIVAEIHAYLEKASGASISAVL